MRSLASFRVKVALLVVVAVTVANYRSAKADFNFGDPENLGPTVNSSALDGTPSVTADGLSLFFNSQRAGGYGHYDIWVSSRQTTADPWGEPVNLGPTINTSSLDGNTVISADGLTLYFTSDRPGGYGGWDIYVTTRPSVSDPWSTPTNLGPPFSSPGSDHGLSITEDGLSAFFGTDRPGGFGNGDLYMSRRATIDDPWGEPVNLGSVVNSPSVDVGATVSRDGLSLVFFSNRPGGYGGFDVWATTRSTTDDEWGVPVNLGPVINTSTFDGAPSISADCSTLYFMSGRPGGAGTHDLWKTSIELILDFDGDGIVDSPDVAAMVDQWHTDDPLYDIAPPPFGDGMVDVKDLTFLAEHLFENVDDPTLVSHWALDEAEGTTAHDSVSGINDYVIGDPLWQPRGGMVNGALQLDGADDCVIASSGINPAEGPFSVFAWVKGDTPGQVIIAQQVISNWLILDTDGKLMTELNDADGLAGPLVSASVITDEHWHRVGLVWDGSTRMLSVDDMIVDEDTQTALLSSDRGLYIGVGKDYALGTFFSGLIDDIRIYNRAVAP